MHQMHRFAQFKKFLNLVKHKLKHRLTGPGSNNLINGAGVRQCNANAERTPHQSNDMEKARLQNLPSAHIFFCVRIGNYAQHDIFTRGSAIARNMEIMRRVLCGAVCS